jgi:hypothetical protein
MGEVQLKDAATQITGVLEACGTAAAFDLNVWFRPV